MRFRSHPKGETMKSSLATVIHRAERVSNSEFSTPDPAEVGILNF